MGLKSEWMDGLVNAAGPYKSKAEGSACEPTHVMAKDAMHYDRKPIRADQCSAKGDEVRTDAIPLSHPEVSDGCQ
jgi:hypothetical protein